MEITKEQLEALREWVKAEIEEQIDRHEHNYDYPVAEDAFDKVLEVFGHKE